MIETIEVSDTESTEYDSSDEDEEGITPAKRPRVSGSADLSFKQKVQIVLRKLSVVTPTVFAVSGRLNAPLINITIKNSKRIVHFPLYEVDDVADIVDLFEQSPYGKGQETVVDTAVRNSWELNSDGFEILNPAWNDFVSNEVVAKIKKEMFIEFSFTASLYKLLLYKTGSFFQPHRDSEKVDGMFATLVIQLPSMYNGGQLIIRHDGKTVTSDFSSTDSSNTFSTFFTAFYCDCEHKVLPVTKGYRICLVYNLISRTKAVAAVPRRDIFELQLISLIKNWQHRGKLVYALKHKYSESSLSLDNLETTDRSVAHFLVHIAKEHDLSVYLGIFNKESSGQSQDSEEDFDSDDEDFSYGNIYSLSKLIAIDGSDIVTSPLDVKFDTEVINEDCFKNIDPYRRTAEPTGNAGVDVTRFYRSAAIVFFPKRFLLEVLKGGGANVTALGKIFLKEIEASRGQVKDDTKLKNWAKEIIALRGNKPIDVIRAIVDLNDIQLTQSLFSSGVILNEVTVELVVGVCEKYGWKAFINQVPKLFENQAKESGVEMLDRIGSVELDKDKKTVVHNSMQGILDKAGTINLSSCSWYVRPQTIKEKTREDPAEQKFLLSACRLAEKVDFQMFDFLKTKPIQLVVPVLLRLVPKNARQLPPFWKYVAEHFVGEMEKEASKPVVLLSWRRNDSTRCLCKDCGPLNEFLASDKVTVSFKMGKDRRKHLHQSLNSMKNISHETDRGGHIGVLVIRKTSQSGSEEAEKRSFSITFLQKLREILPK
ncbi:hypothetical protein Bhyg_16662 [Pseudolycoriella hygida]|uniref:Prolyl 4-hydroxylase alpha subunit Fe(2+) 2OG dioxygenase domain-containing protein n=1 Tax=Pseudolycoriella hygida TaxID=35572 RepID=A0A9Q0MIR5_9DIPT|nr:hypothetical protein Bhyg_16662 [Pseudolycoriella hygida]